MSQAKIISIIDHENHALRSDIATGFAIVLAEAIHPIKQQLNEINKRIQKLEEQTAQTAYDKYVNRPIEGDKLSD